MTGEAAFATVGRDGSAQIDSDVGDEIKAVEFTADGPEHIVGGGDGQFKVGVWRMTDGKEMGTIMDARDVLCPAVAQDGRWITGGTFNSHAFVWDAKMFEKVLTHWVDLDDILAVDFSPDSTPRGIVEPHHRCLGCCSLRTSARTSPRQPR